MTSKTTRKTTNKTTKNTQVNSAQVDSASEAGQPTGCPIAIVGMGCRFPKASGLNEYWANIKAGIDAITPIPETHWKPEDYFDADKKAPDMTYAKTGGFIDPIDFDPLEFGITPNNLEATDTTQLLGMVASRDALRDAGYATSDDLHDGRAFDRDRCSAILGVTGTLELVIPLGARLGHPHWKKALKDAGVDAETAADVVERISNSYVPWQENSFPGLLGNVAAGRIANRFNLGGTNCVVDAACASSLSAIHLAMMELQTGRSDMAITGGIDSFNDIFMFMCFSKTPALSPTGHSRPFSAVGDGTILGEGVGVVIMKRLADAERDGDRIYAVMKGMGSSSDGLGNAVYAPSAAGQAKALRNAYHHAGISPAAIEMVEAHGTGTIVGDRIELEALTEVYREANATDTWCSVGSVKSMIGHAKAAAGVANIIKASMALHNKVLPPSIKIERPLDIIAPGTAPHYANTVKRPWVSNPAHKRSAAVSSFGFGGSNFHCVLEEAQTHKTHIDWDESAQIVAWSAADIATLRNKMQVVSENHPRIHAQTLRADFSTDDACRLVIVSENPKTLDAQITQALEQLSERPSTTSWSLPTGIYYGYGSAHGCVATVFPGQGSQRVGMLRDLSCQFPEMIQALDDANNAFGKTTPQQRLSDAIYPIPVFDSASEKAQETHLRQTDHTQPALGAVSIGAWHILQRMGLACQHFAGHSFGEIPALCAAGYISDSDMHHIACTRGSLMAQGTGDRGSMLAVSAPLAVIQQHIDEQQFDVIIANRNAPKQAILSGATSSIEAAAVFFKSVKIRSTVLPVAAAFHSRFVAEAEKPFHDALKKISFKKPVAGTQCYANVSATAYPHTSAKMKTMLSQQLVNPVQFVEQIQEMYAQGVRHFIECGAGNVLSNLIAKILPASDYETISCISIDASKGTKNGIADMAKCIALTASLGHPIELTAWDNTFALAKSKPAKMSVPICGANHRSSYTEIPPRAPRPAPVAPAVATATAPVASAPSAMPPMTASAATTITNEHMHALQQMQQQTAQLHQQYLSNQESSLQLINQLMQQHTGAALVTPTSTPAHSVPAPVSATAIAPVTAIASTTAAVTVPAPVALSTNHLEENLLAVVSEKTGYPTEMLTSDMNLDADLGIDSIKRVEILSALQERMPDLPTIQAEDMGAIQTLQDIINYCATSEDVATPTLNARATAIPAISASLMAIVADKTGYPQEMLQLDMDLDADLGIDSIKRVEILSALQEQHPELPSVQAEDMGSLRTLQDIVDYLEARTSAETPSTIASHGAVAPAESVAISASLMAIVADKTGYPQEMLQLDMDLDADLGIDSIKRVEILSALQEQHPELPSVQAEDMGSLRTLQDIVGYLEHKMPAASQVTNSPALQTAPSSRSTQADLLAVVSDKTGYPIDMLTPDMALDADLGIDSIKRVEILSALQEKNPALPEISAEDLGGIHTLQDIIDACSQALPTAPTTISATAPANTSSTDFAATLIQVVADKTGYPAEMIELDMHLDADLGIDSIKRVEILSAVQEALPDAPTVHAEDLGTLNTLRQIIEYLQHDDSQAASDTPADAVTQTDSNKNPSIIRQPLSMQRIDDTAVCTLPIQATDVCVIIADSSDLAEDIRSALPCSCTIIQAGDVVEQADIVIICASHITSQADILSGFTSLQTALPVLKKSAGRCIALTHLGGQFAIRKHVPTATADILSAAWMGMIKTAAHEYPEVFCKVIDRDAQTSVTEIISEMQDDKCIEIALHNNKRYQPQLTTSVLPAHDETDTAIFSADDCIVISGGARGVTAEIAVALARNYHVSLALLGRSPLLEQEQSCLLGASDEAAIKKIVMTQWSAFSTGTDTMTPKTIAQATARICAQREIRSTLARIQAHGSTVSYHSVDVCDAAAVNSVCADIRTRAGNIRGIVHGAGILNDKFIADKTTTQFAQVLSTKVDGALNLLAACATDELKGLVFFSSSTARFGRTGQIDYAAANEILNKLAQREQTQRAEHCAVLSINWGPWDGGMVTPALKKLFASEGVGVIDLDLGAQYLCDELNDAYGKDHAKDHATSAIEIVILGGTEENGDNNTVEQTSSAVTPIDPQIAMHAVFNHTLSVATHHFLKSHVIGGKAVLPLAVIMEWLIHAAMNDNPGLSFVGLEDLRTFKGVIMNGSESYTLTLTASEATWDNTGTAAVVVALYNGDTLHARARILLADSYSTASASSAAQARTQGQDNPPTGNPYSDKRLFHGSALHGITNVHAVDATGITVSSTSAPLATEWIEQPLRSEWYTDPLIIDVAFQAMILWSHQQHGCPSLPTRIGSYQQFQAQLPAPCRLVARITGSSAHKACANIEFLDQQGTLIARINDYECVIDQSLRDSFADNTLS